MNQESCVINGGHTTKQFKLEQRVCQSDPVSAYLFTLVLKKLFIKIIIGVFSKKLSDFAQIPRISVLKSVTLAHCDTKYLSLATECI